MKFLPEGPSIPDELLEERDRGNVVFFCGAGVSLSAGMPTFPGLCEHVVRKLGVPANAQSKTMLEFYDDRTLRRAPPPPLDQIFNVLQQEYDAGEIDYEISRRLKPRRNASLTAHETILRLSRSADGKTQLVTTNFDYLFEKGPRTSRSRLSFRLIFPTCKTIHRFMDWCICMAGSTGVCAEAMGAKTLS